MTKEIKELTIGKDVIDFGANVLIKGQDIVASVMPKCVFWYFMRERFGHKVINKNSVNPIYTASLGKMYADKYNIK